MKYELQDDGLWLPGDDSEPSRRAFLKLAGFGVASAGLAGCSRAPSERALVAPTADTMTTPGVAYHLATTCGGCSAACGVLARCRDGRPLKLEGNPAHPASRGGLCATGQGQVLELYDGLRPRGPQQQGTARTWAEADAALASLRESGRVRLLTGTVTSPTTRAWIERYLAGCSDGRHVEIDAVSHSAALDAHQRTHGVRALPRLRLERARVVVSFDADPLGAGSSPVEHTAGWADRRRPEQGPLSKWWQFEAAVSLTGGAADRRLRLAPWETRAALTRLVAELEALAANQELTGSDEAPHGAALHEIAQELWAARGEAVVLVGANDLDAQLLGARANGLLEAYGTDRPLDLARPSRTHLGDDGAAAALAAELESGSVDLLVVAGCNPAYERPDLAPHLERAGTLVACGMPHDETSALADWHLPEPHALERWDDEEAQVGVIGLRQPAVPLLFDGRTLRATLAAWCGDAREDRELLEAHLREEVYPLLAGAPPFEEFLLDARRRGLIELPATDAVHPTADPAALPSGDPDAAPDGLGLVLYEKVGLRAGVHAHNPWLQELPDPVTKITWDNYACLSPTRAEDLDLQEGDVIALRSEGFENLELPVHIQPGQHDEVIAVALGYGRTGTDRFAKLAPDWLEGRATVRSGETIGVAAAAWLSSENGYQRRAGLPVEVSASGRHHALAAVQDYHRLELPPALAPKGAEVRDAVRLADAEGKLHPTHGHHLPDDVDLWPEDHARPGHQWAMSIDLSACTGCSACVVACQAENNVPVVGRDEVRRHREMHWLRIDRYYRGDGDSLALSHQPMMCHHCDNAPCEAVCPVLATVHSSEGLNQQVYNRCVGTRYCANTCPYKVRRFNWFEYPRDDEAANHALNPDVVVRSRGVMEKCSFCAQRIQEAKNTARREGRALTDGEVRTACQQSCPSQAIVFGDVADQESQVSGAMTQPRAYRVLAELNVKPSVGYLAEARHHPEQEAAEDSHAH